MGWQHDFCMGNAAFAEMCIRDRVGSFLQKCGYKIKVFNSIDFSKSMHYNPLSYIRNEADILKFVDVYKRQV